MKRRGMGEEDGRSGFIFWGCPVFRDPVVVLMVDSPLPCMITTLPMNQDAGHLRIASGISFGGIVIISIILGFVII